LNFEPFNSQTDPLTAQTGTVFIEKEITFTDLAQAFGGCKRGEILALVDKDGKAPICGVKKAEKGPS
jgi:hypothetical protein